MDLNQNSRPKHIPHPIQIILANSISQIQWLQQNFIFNPPKKTLQPTKNTLKSILKTPKSPSPPRVDNHCVQFIDKAIEQYDEEMYAAFNDPLSDNIKEPAAWFITLLEIDFVEEERK